MTKNSLGLDRHIPDDISLIIRKACGFGCVLCGSNIYQYEHIEPEFKDATFHDPKAIALLCGSCHGNVTRKLWSKEKVKDGLKNPYCLREGFSWGHFDFGLAFPTVKFAGSVLKNCPIPVQVMGVSLFEIKAPEEVGAPFRLSAFFADSSGKKLLEIKDNEWRVSAEVWDAKFVGGRISISQSEGDFCLVLKADPPNGIAIEKIRMAATGYVLEGDETKLSVFRANDLSRPFMNLSKAIVDNCQIGFSLN